MPSPIIERSALLAAALIASPLHAEPKAAEQPLDEVGYALAMEGKASMAIRGAHRALPHPAYVEVTALATGRTILVEVTEGGAGAPGEVVDLSCGAIRQLGLAALPAAVRVRRVSPPDQERDVLSAGRAAAARLDAPAGLLSALRHKLPSALPSSVGKGDCGLPSRAPEPTTPPPPKPLAPLAETPKPAPVPIEKSRAAVQPPKGLGYSVQVAALSNRARADTLARSIGGHVVGTGSVFRVRTGPYPSEAAARAALPALRAKGFADARVMPNEGH